MIWIRARAILGAVLLLTGIAVLSSSGDVSAVERIIGGILILFGLDLRYQERR